MNEGDLILIVEDEASLRRDLRDFLTRLEFTVAEATTGEEALAMQWERHPDLVLLDIGLPDMSGLEVCMELKSGWAKDVPVIFLGSQEGTAELQQAFQAGGVDYVIKPFHFHELWPRIQTHIELTKQRQQLHENQTELLKALFDAKVLNAKLIEINEKLRQSEGLKSQFLSNMRNEINNPLSVLLGIANEISDPDMSIENLRILGSLTKLEALRMDFQMRNIFCAGDLEAGEAVPTITHVDVISILRNIMDSFTVLARPKSVSLRSSVPETLFFETDASMLRVICENLIANAIEFSRDGGDAEISAHMDGDVLIVQVRDEGIGIRPEDHGAIFEQFRQLETGSTRSHQGSGLGLSVVKALLELLNGWIDLESEPSRGSLFTCSIPRGALSNDSQTESFEGNMFIFGEPEEM